MSSQFIVVSLKEGMFTNANVIFRTSFIDGISAVKRTVGVSLKGQEQAKGDEENANKNKNRRNGPWRRSGLEREVDATTEIGHTPVTHKL